MRKLIYHAQTTLNNRIANAEGTFWEPFAWGDPEQAFVNAIFLGADTWVMSRPIYEAVDPWWNVVASGRIPADVPDVSDVSREFAAIFATLAKMAISRTLPATADDLVFSGEVAPWLQELKEAPGKDIMLAVGPETLEPLLAVPGLIDELLLVIHPAIISGGPRLFAKSDLTLRLIEATPFPAGAIVARYEVQT
jgi:dihydrofolate reductase